MAALKPSTFGTCNRAGCDTVLPWDMPAIGINGVGYCSPECAKQTDIVDVESVCLHDPQYHVDRPDHVEDDCVDMYRELGPNETLDEAIDEIAEWFDAPFRV